MSFLPPSSSQAPLPFFTGEEGPKRSLGGEGLYTGLGKTLTSHRFAAGPSSPVRTGEGDRCRETIEVYQGGP
jgi:hypothetical protein